MQLVAHEDEVSHAGDAAVFAYGVDHPEAEDFGEFLAGLEEAFDAAHLHEERVSVGGNGETEAEQERAVGPEGGALDVERIVALVDEAVPLLVLLFTTLYRPGL